ncbi:winged helix DNA-binding domain-containing protein [Thalassococcus sp. CAU 1522]|uniref:Winged helix DNA-binding domain-containing protein n=1 Tax=Thalassococcus arenae TaxID=2851652 RepID=A0ABS6N4T4_9RHOB|nr:crosslink repair DNA glycosylase YcaQ family protein [Thalassococcus arenae]MBV2359022.1 winged helix DNA-binding domain-containing protein [Thalassococcus arenae]
MQLPNRAARRLFLHRHALAEAPSGPGKGDDLLNLITRLGFVQVDSVRTVERAHHMILFARRPPYRPKHLDRLLHKDRSLFEHWTHDASVIPTEFYPHWRVRFRRDADALLHRWRKWRRDDFEACLNGVRRHISERGPASSVDVGEGEARNSGGWWDWHPSKTALEFLWLTGELAVCHREGFRKYYDLAHRVHPDAATGPIPHEANSLDWLNNAALDRLGFATSGEISAFWATVTRAEAKDWVEAERKAGRLAPVSVQGADGRWRACFARPNVLEQAQAAPEPPPRLRVLSPFDPALRDRNRAERLFGFRYRIEIFTPAPKREYGYYVFPLLEGDRLVGRIDMSGDRDTGALRVDALWPERGVQWGKGRQGRLEAELDRVARFAGLTGVAWREDWLRAPK